VEPVREIGKMLAYIDFDDAGCLDYGGYESMEFIDPRVVSVSVTAKEAGIRDYIL
jgi:hypothetical protein